MSWLFSGNSGGGKDHETLNHHNDEDEEERSSLYDSAFTYNTERQFQNNYSYAAYAPEEPEDVPASSDLDANALFSKIVELFFVVLSSIGVLFTFPFSLFLSFVSSFEKLIVFRLGRVRKIHGPGTVFVLPCIDNVAKIDMRVSSFEIPTLQVITADRGLVEMTTVVFSKVVDPMAAHCGLQNRDQTMRSLAYNVISNQVVKKMLYDLTNPTYLSNLLEDCQKEINTFCKNLGVESTKISVTQMNVVKQGENQAMNLFNTLLKSDMGSQVMQHFTPHIKAYMESNGGAANTPKQTQPNPFTSYVNSQKQVAAFYHGQVGKYYRIRCVDSKVGPVEFDINLKQAGRAGCDWTTHPGTQHQQIDVAITLQKETLFNLVNGAVSPMSAYINGQVTIAGPVDAAVALKHLAERAKDCK
uniref:Band 7 domain-containing protein n=1 Tax=Ditylenchus dipsaci TaxID=166011 RepID=A0A915E318_9BILA